MNEGRSNNDARTEVLRNEEGYRRNMHALRSRQSNWQKGTCILLSAHVTTRRTSHPKCRHTKHRPKSNHEYRGYPQSQTSIVFIAIFALDLDKAWFCHDC